MHPPKELTVTQDQRIVKAQHVQQPHSHPHDQHKPAKHHKPREYPNPQGEVEYCLSNNASWNLTNTNRMDTRLLVKKNKTAGHKGRHPIRMDSFSTQMKTYSSHSRAQCNRSRLKEQHKRCQAVTSKPEGPATPAVHREAEQMASAFKPLNIIGFTGLGVESSRMEGCGGLPRGCLSRTL